MKKVIFAAALAAAVMASAETKVAAVNMLELVNLHPRHEGDSKLLHDTEARYQKDLDSLRDEIERLAAECRDIQDEVKNPMLAPKAKEDAARRFDEAQKKGVAAQNAYREKAQGYQRELSELENSLMRAITESIRETVRKYAEENGVDYVADIASSPFVAKGLDVTDEVLKAMGVDPVKARADREARKTEKAAKDDAPEKPAAPGAEESPAGAGEAK